MAWRPFSMVWKPVFRVLLIFCWHDWVFKPHPGSLPWRRIQDVKYDEFLFNCEFVIGCWVKGAAVRINSCCKLYYARSDRFSVLIRPPLSEFWVVSLIWFTTKAYIIVYVCFRLFAQYTSGLLSWAFFDSNTPGVWLTLPERLMIVQRCGGWEE
jgi:hypothetical protein